VELEHADLEKTKLEWEKTKLEWEKTKLEWVKTKLEWEEDEARVGEDEARVGENEARVGEDEARVGEDEARVGKTKLEWVYPDLNTSQYGIAVSNGPSTCKVTAGKILLGQSFLYSVVAIFLNFYVLTHNKILSIFSKYLKCSKLLSVLEINTKMNNK
jgi:hypothetical protein